MTLVEFLRARLDEDEAARGRIDDALSSALAAQMGRHVEPYWTPARVRAEVEAKRRIVEHLRFVEEKSDWWSDMEVAGEMEDGWHTLANLATVYADHPDYDEAWRP